MSVPFRLFVANLDYAVTDAEFFEFFSRWGNITKVKIVRDAEGNSRGFGFVATLSDADIPGLLGLDGYQFHGRRLTVRLYRPRPSEAPEKSQGS
jgi:RNA recognition motif-containing protein